MKLLVILVELRKSKTCTGRLLTDVLDCSVAVQTEYKKPPLYKCMGYSVYRCLCSCFFIRTDTIEDILRRKELQCTKEATQRTPQWKENSEMAAYLKNNAEKVIIIIHTN